MKKESIKKLVVPSFAVAATGIGLGIAGDAFQSEGLQQAGQVATNFVAPVVAISAGGYLIKQLREINPSKKKKKFGL